MADAGCILEALSEHIAPHDHIMPLDLGAKGRYARTPFSFANSYAVLAVRSVETCPRMRVDFGSYVMGLCMEACLASKLCYRTGLSWITSPPSERIILVKLQASKSEVDPLIVRIRI